MSGRVKVLSGSKIAHPEALLAGSLETGIVRLTLGTQRIDGFERDRSAVNGKAVVVRNGDVFGAATVFLAVVPAFVITGTDGIGRMGTLKGTAKLLTGASMFREFTIPMHGKTGIADGISNREFLEVFHTARVKRDKAIAVINITDSVVEGLDIIPLVGEEVTFMQRKSRIGSA